MVSGVGWVLGLLWVNACMITVRDFKEVSVHRIN